MAIQSPTQPTLTAMAMVSVTVHLHLHCQPTVVLQDRTHSRTMLLHLRILTVTAYQTNLLKALKPTSLPIRMTTAMIGPTKTKHSVVPVRPMHQAHQSTAMAMEPVTLLTQTTMETTGLTRMKHSVEPTPRKVQAYHSMVMTMEFVTLSTPRHSVTPTMEPPVMSLRLSSTNPTSSSYRTCPEWNQARGQSSLLSQQDWNSMELCPDLVNLESSPVYRPKHHQ